MQHDATAGGRGLRHEQPCVVATRPRAVLVAAGKAAEAVGLEPFAEGQRVGHVRSDARGEVRFRGVGPLASMRAENDVTDQSPTTLHTAPYVWPPGETAVPWSCASGAAFDFAIECGLGDRGSADLVAECVNGLLAQGAVPRTLAAVITGEDEVIEDLGLGIERACRAHAFTLVACTSQV